MEKEINLEKIVAGMKEKYGDDLTEIEKSRYLYLELGKLLKYDLNMLAVSYKVSDDSYYKELDLDNINSNTHSCRQMAIIYSKLLEMCDIKNRVITAYNAVPDDETPHKYVKVNLQDGRTFIADMTWDPEKIQTGQNTKGFGKTDGKDCFGDIEAKIDIISDEEIKAIDEKIGYIEKDAKYDYMDSFLQAIREEMQDEEKMKRYVEVSSNGTEVYDPSMLIGYKLDLIKNKFPLKDLGYIEGNNYLRDLYNSFFTDEEKKNMAYVKLRNEFDENGKALDNIEYFGCYIWTKEGEEPRYYIYQEGHDLEQWDKAKVQEKVKSKRYEKPFRRKNYPGEEIFYDEK